MMSPVWWGGTVYESLTLPKPKISPLIDIDFSMLEYRCPEDDPDWDPFSEDCLEFSI